MHFANRWFVNFSLVVSAEKTLYVDFILFACRTMSIALLFLTIT